MTRMNRKNKMAFEFRIFLKLLLIVWSMLTVIVVPFGYVFIKKIRQRILFEAKNFYYRYKQRPDHERSWNVADVAFEVSSEGELEQIRPLLNEYIELEKKIELIFFSESVEGKAIKLYELHPNIKIYRYPIITYSLFSFFCFQNLKSLLTAPKLILCRYDFFPQLLLYGSELNIEFILLSASLKNKDYIFDRRSLKSYFMKKIFNSFDLIVTASSLDHIKFQKLFGTSEKLVNFDLRTVQIINRLRNKRHSLGHYLDSFQSIFDKYPKNSRLILGSAWPVDLAILKNDKIINDIKSKKLFVAIAPHKLDEKHLEELTLRLTAIMPDIPIYRFARFNANFTKETLDFLLNEFFEIPGIVVITIPGILCELYAYFLHCYVGGGFGRSIHSVLEPALAGAHVYIGPKTHRSTEYDYVVGMIPDRPVIHVINKQNDFLEKFRVAQEYNYDEKFYNTLYNDLDDEFLNIKNLIL